MPHPQVLPAPLELVKLQLHSTALNLGPSRASFNISGLNPVASSTAVPVRERALSRACTRRNRSAATDFDALFGIARSSPAGHSFHRKNCSVVITLAASLTAVGSGGS